jgi:hypothetical protein
MSRDSRILKKSYAMQRMASAIERAVRAGSGKEKERAARWVAAWGMLCGIRSGSIRLRRSEVAGCTDDRVRQLSDPIEIPAERAQQGISTPQAKLDGRAAEPSAISELAAENLASRDTVVRRF